MLILSLCTLLIVIGVVQAVHVHRQNSAVPGHECTICFAVHSPAITLAAFHPDPVLIRAQLVIAVEVPNRSVGFASSLCIRPPPAA